MFVIRRLSPAAAHDNFDRKNAHFCTFFFIGRSNARRTRRTLVTHRSNGSVGYDVSRVILTTEFLRSPFDVNAVSAALLGVRRDRGAQTFAIAALVASTRVEYAPIDVVFHSDLRVTRLERGRFEYAALLHCPLSAVRMKRTSVLNVEHDYTTGT